MLVGQLQPGGHCSEEHVVTGFCSGNRRTINTIHWENHDLAFTATEPNTLLLKILRTILKCYFFPLYCKMVSGFTQVPTGKDRLDVTESVRDCADWNQTLSSCPAQRGGLWSQHKSQHVESEAGRRGAGGNVVV